VQEAEPGALEAMVERVVYLGFEVRAELLPTDGPALSVQLTRAEADQMELREGEVVWVRAERPSVRSAA
jgi:sulfate transport system ATP-binding protein